MAILRPQIGYNSTTEELKARSHQGAISAYVLL